MAISSLPLKETVTECLLVDRWKLSYREKGCIQIGIDSVHSVPVHIPEHIHIEGANQVSRVGELHPAVPGDPARLPAGERKYAGRGRGGPLQHDPEHIHIEGANQVSRVGEVISAQLAGQSEFEQLGRYRH